MVLIEFIVLLSTVLTCTRIYHHNQKAKNERQHVEQIECDSTSKDYGFQKRPSQNFEGYSNETYAMTDSFRQNYKLLDKVWEFNI